jgi:hypothetical protein
VIGYAVAMRRKDGTLYFSLPAHGFATPVFFTHREAQEVAKDCQAHALDAVVVKVEYRDPFVLGPKRYEGLFA